LPADFDVRLERLRGRVSCAQRVVSDCVPYAPTQPAPEFLRSLVDSLFRQTTELVPDEHWFDDVRTAGFGTASATLLDTAALLAVMELALEKFSPVARFGFNR